MKDEGGNAAAPQDYINGLKKQTDFSEGDFNLFLSQSVDVTKGREAKL